MIRRAVLFALAALAVVGMELVARSQPFYPPLHWVVGAPPQTLWYFEFTYGTKSGGQSDESVNFQFGFADSGIQAAQAAGIPTNTFGVAVKPGGVSINSCGTFNVLLEPTYNLNDVVGVALDAKHQRFWVKNWTHVTAWYPDNLATPTGTGYDISCIIGTGPVHIIFGGPGFARCAYVSDVITLNPGSSAFTGTMPPGYAAWDTTLTTTWGTLGSITRGPMNGGGGTVTLQMGVGGFNNLAAFAATGGQITSDPWDSTHNWLANTYTGSNKVLAYADCGGATLNSGIYYNPAFIASGDLNAQPFNNAWWSGTVLAVSNTSKARH